MKLEHPGYQKFAQALRRKDFWTAQSPHQFPEAGIELAAVPFVSAQGHHLLGQDSYRCKRHGLDFGAEQTEEGVADCNVQENLSFQYPVLRGISQGKAKHLIVVLNGLNERSYAKYLPWGYQLWKATGAAVAFFPMSFHVDRVSPEWGRTLDASLARRKKVPGNENAHPYNCVLSERLESRPERFFWGGVQSYGDVVTLMRAIRRGQHPLVEADAQVDFLGYSAGGYLALGLLLGDEDGLFTRSRGVLFESGAAMRHTRLSTRLIMDLACEVAMMKLYVRFTQKLANPRLAHWLDHHPEGRWFKAMFGEERERPLLESRLRDIAPRLLAISNTNDSVIPPGAVFDLLKGKHRDTGVRVEELTLGVHEHPFVCVDYEQKDRRFVTETLDEEALGAQFAQFIGAAVSMLQPLPSLSQGGEGRGEGKSPFVTTVTS